MCYDPSNTIAQFSFLREIEKQRMDEFAPTKIAWSEPVVIDDISRSYQGKRKAAKVQIISKRSKKKINQSFEGY